VNDGSTDDSLNIINTFAKKDKRIKVINKQNEGLPYARKSGLTVASGDYIFHLDGDDYLPLTAIETLVIHANETNADIILGNFEFVYKNQQSILFNKYCFSELDNIGFLKELLVVDAFFIWGKLIRKDIHIKIETPQYIQYTEDVVAMIQLAFYASKITKCDVVTYYYYCSREESSTNIMSKKSYLQWYASSCFVVNFLQSKKLNKVLRKELLIFQSNQLFTYLMHTDVTGFYRKKDVNLLLKEIFRYKKQYDTLKMFSKNVKVIFFIAKYSPRLAVFLYKLHQYVFSKH
jgi:glycosyltransferase involved in cell wall biosynthesis